MYTSPYDSKKILWTIFIGFTLTWFYMLGVRSLVPTDEGRYAEMAREMLASGDWVTQRLNGIKYFEKPPLQNWMNTLSFQIFGLGDWQARLWTGLCGFAGIFFTSYTAFKLYGRRIAIHTAFILGSCFWWAALGHINTLDMGLAGMMTISLCSLLLAQREDASRSEQRNYMLLCWAGMALATMSKGLIGFVLPGAVLVIYTLMTRQWSLWARLHLIKGLLLFFAITTPWFILVWQANPEHPHFFFIHEHFQRFTSTVHKRGGSWYYFIPLLIIGITPWLFFMAQGLWQGLQNATKKHTVFNPLLMCAIWAGFIFFFFSISGSKLPSYILPIFPALAILIAVYMEKATLLHLRLNTLLLCIVVGASLILITQLNTFTQKLNTTPFYLNMLPWIYVGCGIAFVCGVLALVFSKQSKDWLIILTAIGGFMGPQMLFVGHDAWGKYSAGVYHLPAIQKIMTSDTQLFSVGRYEQSFPFYLQKTMTLVEHPDEMAFGLQQEPHLWIPKREDFYAQWQNMADHKKPAIAFVAPSIHEEMKAKNITMIELGSDSKRYVISTTP